ncbi:MAG: PAS domain S-box protein [Nitrospirae bacterium]|nr:PAS domain S-box protein [Nitrospirota bacterium]
MRLSLKTKVTVFITVTVLVISMVSTFFFTTAHKKSIEREIIARGRTLSEALSHAVDEGLAEENLDFIKNVEDIVHTKDVILAQIFTDIWLPVDAFPLEQFEMEPDPKAKEHFNTAIDPFHIKETDWFDFYSPVFFHRIADKHDALHGSDTKQFLIGFVRVRISSAQMKQELSTALRKNILLSLILTAISIVAINLFIRKYVLVPLMNLQASVSRHKQGELPETVPIHSNDEIGQLASEFNKMTIAIKEREERIAEEKERLAVTLRSIGDAVIVTDVSGMITMINRVAEQHTGWAAEDAAGKPLSEVFHIINEKTRERCSNPVAKVLETGLIQGLANHTALIRKDNSEIIIEDSAAPIRDRSSQVMGVVLVFRDMTERKRTEEELLKTEKLQSIGLLAGGLAHDFNNLLTSIVGNVSMAKMFIHDRNKVLERLTDAETATRRATDLTYQLLTFAKGSAPIKKISSIVDIIKESAGFTLSGTNVAAAFVIPETPWTVDIDMGQMSQVFNNLIINAVHAMPDGGKIEFTVANTALSENEIPALHEGAYVKISLADTGTGIAREHLSRIFDPYFTTKQKGSGLGLASAYSIVKNHDGYLSVESILGKGTTFHLYLRASQGMTGTIAGSPEEKNIAKGSGRILVMDDEKLIRDIAGEMLRSLGYEVELAKDGSEAIELYQRAFEAHTPFDIVIMDLTIPGGMGGKEAIQKLRSIDPNIRAIVSSGYSNDPIMAEHEKYGFRGVIIKPYNLGVFSKSVREVMKG